MARGTALWESLVGKSRGKASDPLIHVKGSVTLLLELGRKAHVHPTLETRADSTGETPEVPQIHVSTGEEFSGSGTDSSPGLRPRHRRERNPERPQATRMGTGLF